jgi:hypothetical protein
MSGMEEAFGGGGFEGAAEEPKDWKVRGGEGERERRARYQFHIC